jgi:hypothetical protein
MRVRRQALELSLALLGVFPVIAQSPAPSAYVFGVHGHWSADNPHIQEVQLGQPVRTGQLIRPGATAEHCSIQVGYVDNSTDLLDCDKNPQGCQKGLTVRSPAVSESSLPARVGAAWNHLFNHGPVPVVFALSRGEAVKGPQEAVLPLTQERLDPSAALLGLDPGEYSLTLRTVPESDESPARLRCNWKPPLTQCSAATSLTPGLFALSVASSAGPAGSPVAVLVAAPPQFDALTRSFAEWKSATAAWPRETRPETIHYFLTAALDALNQTVRP